MSDFRFLSVVNHLKEVLLLAILTRNIYSHLPLQFLPIYAHEYNSGEKTASYRPFKNGHFVRACVEKILAHQYKENCAGNIYSKHNQIRTYVQCAPNHFKTLYLIDLSTNFKDSEKCWPLLCLNFNRGLQFSSTSPRLQDGYHYCMCTNRQLLL